MSKHPVLFILYFFHCIWFNGFVIIFFSSFCSVLFTFYFFLLIFCIQQTNGAKLKRAVRKLLVPEYHVLLFAQSNQLKPILASWRKKRKIPLIEDIIIKLQLIGLGCIQCWLVWYDVQLGSIFTSSEKKTKWNRNETRKRWNK